MDSAYPHSITDAPSSFPVFPKLPIELRLKIWKHALPGPRVLPLPTENFIGREEELKRHLDAVNSLIGVKFACKEALGVVESSYDKLFVQSLADETVSPDPNIFLYLDYDVDIVYTDRTLPLSKPRRMKILQELIHVKHLAAYGNPRFGLYPPNHEDLWNDIRFKCRNLRMFTILHSGLMDLAVYGEECRLIKLPANYGDPITLPHPVAGFEPRRLMSESVGRLKFMCAEAAEIKRGFQAYVEKYQDWAELSFETSLRARRKTGTNPWKLEYWIHDEYIEHSLRNSTVPDIKEHWHSEWVTIAGEDLMSCRGVENSDFCQICHSKRWPGRDTFWLERV